MCPNNNITVEVVEREESGFPEFLTFDQMHDLEGSLWSDRAGQVHMFCQVDQNIFAMILLSEGNRNVSAFTYEDYASKANDFVRGCIRQHGFTRFNGIIKIKSKSYKEEP